MADRIELLERRNRTRIVALVFLATLNYIVAVVMAAIALGIGIALAIIFYGGDVFSDTDAFVIFAIGLAAASVGSAVIGILVGLFRTRPSNTVIGITAGLRESLSPDELEEVLLLLDERIDPPARARRRGNPPGYAMMLTPPGPTNRPTTISRTPQMISRRRSAAIPRTTRTTAMSHRMNAMRR